MREVGEGKNERGSECSLQSVPRLWACPVEFDSQPEIQPLNLNRRETEQTFVAAFSPRLSPSRSPSLTLTTYYFSPPPSISECVWTDLCFAVEEREEVQKDTTREKRSKENRRKRTRSGTKSQERRFSLLHQRVSPQTEQRDQLQKAVRRELECET